MRNIVLTLVVLLVAFLLLNGFPELEDKKMEDHIWKEQTDTIRKAEAVNQLIQDAAEKQRQLIEKQIQQ